MNDVRSRGNMTDDPSERFSPYYRAIVSYLVRSFGFSTEEAQEIAQDAFVSVLSRMREHPIDAPWTYLKVSAHNRAVNVIRDRTRRRRFEPTPLDALPHISEELLENFFTGEPPKTPEEETIAGEQMGRVRKAIDDLPPIQRQSLLLWLRGLQYDQIAGTLGITMDAVRSRLRDAKKTLRERLGEAPGRKGDDDRTG
jgi:RNA polymerase sigma-70 factor (ECF subfamily)